MAQTMQHGVYGVPPAELAEVPEGAIQFSPRVPGAERLDDFAGRLASMVMLAPAGTIERRHEIALALSALAPAGEMIVLAPRDRGGARLGAELAAFGLDVEERSKRHHRICRAVRRERLSGIEAAIAEGAPRIVEELGLWSQPGVFAFDRVDPASALLIDHLPSLAGRGADFGCGIGVLAHAALRSGKVERLLLVDVDRRAIDCARRNLDGAPVDFLWADIRQTAELPEGLDFVVSNPPFHDGGAEDRALGQSFIRRAASCLRKGGAFWLTANRHLPYERVLQEAFARVRPIVEDGGYKVYEAIR